MLIPGHPRISADPAVCGGKPCIAGTRVRVFDVLEGLSNGDTPADIVEALPWVDADAIRACLAYAADVIGRPIAIAAE